MIREDFKLHAAIVNALSQDNPSASLLDFRLQILNISWFLYNKWINSNEKRKISDISKQINLPIKEVETILRGDGSEFHKAFDSATIKALFLVADYFGYRIRIQLERGNQNAKQSPNS